MQTPGKIVPSKLDIFAIGTNTTIFVIAEAITATTTSDVPLPAASLLLLPISLCLKIFSKTTIEFATRIPTDVDNPIRDIIFSENPE